jgi:hypothetical protein
MFAFGTAFSAAPEEIFLLCGSVCMWVCGWIGLVVGVFGLLGLVGAWFWQWKACDGVVVEGGIAASEPVPVALGLVTADFAVDAPSYVPMWAPILLWLVRIRLWWGCMC